MEGARPDDLNLGICCQSHNPERYAEGFIRRSFVVKKSLTKKV